MRTISVKSLPSTVGKRSRCARTAPIGRPRISSGEPLRNGTASSRFATRRRSHAPSCPARRTTFQPCAAGIKNTGEGAVSISQLLPGNQLRNVAVFADDHLDDAFHVAGFSDTGHAQHLIPETDQRGKLFKLVHRKPESHADVIDSLEGRIVFRAID